MHEMSMVEALVGELERLRVAEGWQEVRMVRLRVGELRAVLPDVMSFCFEIATRETPLAGARFEIVPVSVRRGCTRCGASWEGMGARCETCGAAETTLLAGMELELDAVEVEMEEEDDATREAG